MEAYAFSGWLPRFRIRRHRLLMLTPICIRDAAFVRHGVP
jgi:hypothetical protein